MVGTHTHTRAHTRTRTHTHRNTHTHTTSCGPQPSVQAMTLAHVLRKKRDPSSYVLFAHVVLSSGGGAKDSVYADAL